MHERIQLLLVDNLTLVRTALTSVLNRRQGMYVVAQANDGGSALHQAMATKPHVILLEPSVPDGGPDLVAGLQSQVSDTHVLVVSRSVNNVSKFFAAGARGFLSCGCSIDELVLAIRQVHAGRVVAAPGAAEDLVENSALAPGSIVHGLGSLTAREQDVTRLVVEGRSNSEIARLLVITEHTVKGHLANILGKLDFANRTQVASYALDHGLGKPPDGPN